MMSRQVLILSYFFVFLTSSVNAQTDIKDVRLKINESLSLKDLSPDFELKPQYSIGFRSQVLTDSWRENRLPLTTSRTPERRQVLLNLWYPAAKHQNTQAHSSYFESDDPYSSAYLQAFERFRKIFLYQESVATTGYSTNFPIPKNVNIASPEAFDRLVATLRNGKAAPGKFPLVFYHSGSQGGFEENAPLFEMLAEQGIAVAAVVGPSEEGDIDASQRALDLMWDDMNLALGALRQDPIIDLNRLALMGFSAGAQFSLDAALTRGDFAAAVLLDTTYETQDFQGSPPPITRHNDKNLSTRTPMLVLAEIRGSIGSSDRFRIYKPVNLAPTLFVDFGNKVSHDDFIWHGLINRAAQDAFDSKGFVEAKQRYKTISKLVLDFLQESFKENPDWTVLPALAKKNLPDYIYRSIKVGSPSDIGVSELMTKLEDDRLVESALKDDLKNGKMSEQRLSRLIQIVRYTQSSDKALLLCAVSANLSVYDQLSCAAIALECEDFKKAKIFVDGFLHKTKKPKKNARVFERIRYEDALSLKAMIAKGNLN